jgi:hypothetical protein
LQEGILEERRLSDIKINDLKMQIIKSKFNQFVTAYVEQNQLYQDSYKGFGIFSRHGSDGRQAARKFEAEFKRNKKQMTSKKDLLESLTDLKIKNPKLLTGNGHAGSFKTYLLAYRDFVNSVDMSQDMDEDLDVVSYVQQYASHNKDIKVLFEQTFKVREVQGNELESVNGLVVRTR